MKFACDAMLGKLAKYLRILGFDTIYVSQKESRAPGHADDRIFLTRRHHGVSRSQVIRIDSEIPGEQLLELKALIKPFISAGNLFSRCLDCNEPLMEVVREDIEQLVPEFVFHHYERFSKCPSCQKVYWEGSHRENMSQLLERLLA